MTLKSYVLAHFGLKVSIFLEHLQPFVNNFGLEVDKVSHETLAGYFWWKLQVSSLECGTNASYAANISQLVLLKNL